MVLFILGLRSIDFFAGCKEWSRTMFAGVIHLEQFQISGKSWIKHSRKRISMCQVLQ